jgi:YggT family protein
LVVSVFSEAISSVVRLAYLISGWITLGLVVWIVLSYIVIFGRVSYDHPVRKAYEFANRIVEPMLRPIRKIVPPLRLGGTALDLSPLVLILGVRFVPAILDVFI